MSKDLLAKRYLVENDYPKSEFSVNDIIVIDRESAHIYFENKLQYSTSSFYITNILKVKNFPYLFRELQWWEQREIEDMPEYVKYKKGHVVKVEHYCNYFTEAMCDFSGTVPVPLRYLLPATETEYNDYIKSLK